MKLKRTVSLALVLILLFSLSLINTFAATGTAVLSTDLSASDVVLLGSFNGWEGTLMSYVGETTVSTTVELAEGKYQFKLRAGDTEYGHPGTVNDTTVTVSDSGWKLSDSINAKCTLIATGGSYTFTFNTETHKLQVVKDGFVPEVDDADSLTVNFGGEALTANVGDTLTYCAFVTADKTFEDIQVILSYNEDKLSLVRGTSADDEALKCCPNFADAVYNSDYEGVVAANASSLAGFDFTEEKLLLTLDFAVLSGGETTLELTIQEMTATDGTSYFTYSTQENDGAALRETLEITDTVEFPSQSLAFNGASLTLYDNLAINFKAAESLFTEVGYTNPYAVFELNGEKFTVTDYTVANGRYVFDFEDISPKNMNDTVKATLYATFDGVEYESEACEYSVAAYCYNMLSKYNTDDYAELRTLLVDLLNYGAATQVYANYNTDALVNASLTAEQSAWGTSEKPAYTSVQNLSFKTIENPTVQWLGGGLNLETAVTMRFKISAENYENLTLKAETAENLWTVPASEFELFEGSLYVFFSGLNAAQMSEPVYITIYEGDTAVSNTICYSVESYAYAKQNSTDTNLVNLLEAMMKYGNSAYAYVN